MKGLLWGRSSGPIGLIAGEGEFPLLFAEAARSLGREVIAIGVKGHTDPALERLVKEIHRIELGGLQDLIDILKRCRLKRVVLAGSIPKKEIYNPDFKMDDTARSFISGTRHKGDDHILKAFALLLKVRCGVSVVDSRSFLKGALAPKGVLTRRIPTPEERSDLKFGCEIAKGIGKLDIGQTVVVKNGVVLAVEAIEGTDRAIARGAELGGKETVVVKMCKPIQDLRFDLPCVGSRTIESLRASSVKVLGIEAGKTIILSREKFIRAADDSGLTVVGL